MAQDLFGSKSANSNSTDKKSVKNPWQNEVVYLRSSYKIHPIAVYDGWPGRKVEFDTTKQAWATFGILQGILNDRAYQAWDRDPDAKAGYLLQVKQQSRMVNGEEEFYGDFDVYANGTHVANISSGYVTKCFETSATSLLDAVKKVVTESPAEPFTRTQFEVANAFLGQIEADTHLLIPKEMPDLTDEKYKNPRCVSC